MQLPRRGLICLLALVLAGCGGVSDAPTLVSATGKVTYKDAPVAGASVTFIIDGSPIANGSTDSEGKFVMSTGGRPGVAIGTAKVGIVKVAAAAEDRSKMTPADMAKMAAASNMKSMAAPKAEIPEKYASPDKSTLTAIIDADGTKNVFEFRLVD